MLNNEPSRRPIKTREAKWAKALAIFLKNSGVTPNHISIASVFFAGLAFTVLFLAPRTTSAILSSVLWILGALCIQARLVCNLIDGMVAVEGGLKTPSGPIFNDLPDRIADPLIILAIGYALPVGVFPDYAMIASTLGWIAALLAILTAYIRVLGGSCGLEQSFKGPLAKQQRMAICTLVAVVAAFLPMMYLPYWILAALLILVVGTAFTCIIRTQAIIRQLQDSTL